ncbi:TraB/GumN family protein [Aquabacterium sp.]|uniref:TraB/GumN family protein n=1 Tax=Aquabacterium sp. TaxID=1872578 RepID=UPI002C05E1B3|nr:TraB/GumN family protein [Aquabacterium sp.]HSW07602.1 TraB/GumN family protein [Aquabacterium sp.]
MTGRNWSLSRAGRRAAAGRLLGLWLALVQRAGANPAAQPAEEAYDHGTLWRIHAATGAVGHLLGTIHIGQTRELAVPPQTWSLLLTANRLVVELAPGSVDPAQLERLQRLSGGESLAGRLDSRELQRLQARLARIGLALRDPQRYRPWVLTQLLQAASPLTLETLDDRLVWQARQQRLPVLSLETLQEQFGAFECLSAADHLLLLKDTLAMPDGFFETLNRDALALYRAQRTGALVALMAERYPISAPVREAAARQTQCIIDARNQRFAQRLQPLLADNGVFAAIGAAHLVGPGGVLAQLAAAGFRIERINTVKLPSPPSGERE